MSIRVIIVDDHNVMRQGLKMILSLDPDFEVVGEAVNGAEAVKLATELKPDVVLMDLLMPVMDGITATALIKKTVPEVEVLALTSVMEDASVVDAIKAGAIGYLIKDKNAEEVLQAIKAAAAGQVQLSHHSMQRLLREMQPANSPAFELTKREMEVLKLLVKGLANREIADELKIGNGTIKTHLNKIFNKLNVDSRTQAVIEAVRLGLIALPSENK
jgi:two-component system, NarL family, response regulator LiaR